MKQSYCKEKHCKHLERIYNQRMQQNNGPFYCSILSGCTKNLIKDIDHCPLEDEEFNLQQAELEWQRQMDEL